jgi:cytochrome c biogenesis protein CcdA
MSLLGLFLVLILIGVVVYCIVRFIPMDPTIKNIVVIVAVIVCTLMALQAFGVLDALRGVQVPRVH